MGSEQSIPRDFTAMNIEAGVGVQPPSLVAVTGATGFIGSHVVRALLVKGFHVRGVVRDPDNAAKLAHLTSLPEAKERLTFAAGDLLVPNSYDNAFTGVDAVVHCAAVVSNKNAVKDPDAEIVQPSVQGSINVYNSVDKHPSIKRVVHTSSVAAVQTYDKPDGYAFSEKDWNTWSSRANGDYYGIAKVEAEFIAHQRATAVAERKTGRYDVVCINPSVVFGECLTKAHTKASPVFLRQLLLHNTQPDVFINWVDARDVAEAHVQALMVPEAGGKRFVISGDQPEHRGRFPALAARMSTLRPDLEIRANVYEGLLYNAAWAFTMSDFEKAVIEKEITLDVSQSKSILGLTYHAVDDTLKTTMDTMVPFIPAKFKKTEA